MNIGDLPADYQRVLKRIKFADHTLEAFEKPLTPWEQKDGRTVGFFEFPPSQTCELGQLIADALTGSGGPHGHLDGLRIRVRALTSVKDPAKTHVLSKVYTVDPSLRDEFGVGLVIDVQPKMWHEHWTNQEWGHLVRAVDFSLCQLKEDGTFRQGKTIEGPEFLGVWGPISPYSQRVIESALAGVERMQKAEVVEMETVEEAEKAAA